MEGLSPEEVADMLKMEVKLLKRLLRLSGISRSYESNGLVGVDTLRLLYGKLCSN